MQSIRAFFGSFCLYHKYGDSAANTTIKCWKIGPWNNKIFIVPAPKGLMFNGLGAFHWGTGTIGTMVLCTLFGDFSFPILVIISFIFPIQVFLLYYCSNCSGGG